MVCHVYRLNGRSFQFLYAAKSYGPRLEVWSAIDGKKITRHSMLKLRDCPLNISLCSVMSLSVKVSRALVSHRLIVSYLRGDKIPISTREFKV